MPGRDYDSGEILEIRQGAVLPLSVNANVAGYADGANTITAVSAITVDAASGVTVSGISIVADNSITATFDATSGVPSDNAYDVCVEYTLNSTTTDILRLRLYVTEGC